MNTNIVLELIIAPGITPQDKINSTLTLLETLKESRNIPFKVFDTLSEKESQTLENEFRIAATRGKFKIVSGGGAALVLSGSKKLNHKHGPILVIRKDDDVIKVFPHGKPGDKGSCITTLDFLNHVSTSESPFIFTIDDRIFTEQDLRNLIIMHSSLIEKDLSFIKVEVPIESAVIDLVFQDRNGNHLLLEFKLNANDRTIGQIMRYNIDSYATTYGLKKNKIRRGIVTISTTGQILQACEANNIELFVLNFQNVGFVY